MSTKKQKLELTWIGKGEEPKLEPRILIENPEYSYGDSYRLNPNSAPLGSLSLIFAIAPLFSLLFQR